MAQWWRVRRGPGQQVGDLPGTHPPGPAGHEATRRSGAAADGASRRNRGVVPGLALDGGGRQLHGCADEAANADFLGYPGASRGQSAFPQARVLGLVECGTHAVLAASIAPGAMVSESVQSSWPLVVSCGTKQSHTRLGCSVRARLVAVSRLAVGHPQGLALTQPHAVKRSPKGCRPESLWADNPAGRGRLAPFPLAGRAGDRWPPAGSTLIVAFHTNWHRAEQLPLGHQHP